MRIYIYIHLYIYTHTHIYIGQETIHLLYMDRYIQKPAHKEAG
jgi:hypothetical protein